MAKRYLRPQIVQGIQCLPHVLAAHYSRKSSNILKNNSILGVIVAAFAIAAAPRPFLWFPCWSVQRRRKSKAGLGGKRGQLPNGREIGVKRLSKDSGQGTEEFKNEVKLIKVERLLVYGSVPNKSLDNYIFGKHPTHDSNFVLLDYLITILQKLLCADQERRVYLNWGKQYEIILGIAWGMLYLHQHSRLKIIHRDLK
ncbi:hypothetical protein RJ641_002055 [Dillenia turbinata]|uniref:Protein kinase domain-containing protein n=1 Tax=Dillenia turbinata TaxID=194707 RepID=A0AAN8ZBV1_9MAGN